MIHGDTDKFIKKFKTLIKNKGVALFDIEYFFELPFGTMIPWMDGKMTRTQYAFLKVIYFLIENNIKPDYGREY